jgi:hypothetical protein
MADATDMSTPVTRDELRAELAPLATKADLRAELAPLVTKVDLELWGRALLARFDAIEHRVLAELARHTRAIVESRSTQIFPPVSRLEGQVFTPSAADRGLGWGTSPRIISKP